MISSGTFSSGGPKLHISQPDALIDVPRFRAAIPECRQWG